MNISKLKIQQELLRQMRPETAQQQYHHMMRMQNGALGGINMKQPANLARAAMANNQNKSVCPALSVVQKLTNMRQSSNSHADATGQASSDAARSILHGR